MFKINIGLFILLHVCATAGAQLLPPLHGRVIDFRSGEGVPFATVKKLGTLQGTIADLDGFFTISRTSSDSIIRLEASQSGYDKKEVTAISSLDTVFIRITRREGVIEEVVVRPKYDKIRRIMNRASRARSDHNPDRYAFYRCNVYYKMVADADFATLAIDSAEARNMRAFQARQHLLVSETYSRRTGRSPGQVQEDVLATRFSGLPNTPLASLVTGVLPFHAANDFLTLNGKEYSSPLAGGWEGRYLVNLSEELQEGTDTLWTFSFRHRRDPNGLRGRLTIHSDGYAVSRLIAEARDTTLTHLMRIEQQYERTDGRWFPRALNYVLDWKQKSSGTATPIFMRGTSRIDSVAFTNDDRYRFDRAHTVRIESGAAQTGEKEWARYRLETLGAREARTYTFNDSVVSHSAIGRIIPHLDALVEGRVPAGPFDIDLKRLYATNPYEKNRFGFGWQTNKRLSERFAFGAWAGYGTKDKAWKYGAFGEAYAGRYKETVFRLQYEDDLRDPGRVTVHPDIDRAYLRQFLLQRVDQVESYQASLRFKTGYLQTIIAARQEAITPKYSYLFAGEGGTATRFKAREGILSLRYAFGERSAPAFGKYFAAGTRYPVLYAKITGGELATDGALDNVRYAQALAAFSWEGAVNHLGHERVLITAGQSWSDAPLPLSKLFAGRGFRGRNAIYVFGGLLTMRPYDYYADRFATLHLRHDFGWKFYHHPVSTPSLGLAYNGMIGTMQNRNRHTGVDFSVPDNTYHEAGVLFNDILRAKYLGVAYFTLNAGYFYHLVPGPLDHKKNGAAVLGLGFSI